MQFRAQFFKNSDWKNLLNSTYKYIWKGFSYYFRTSLSYVFSYQKIYFLTYFLIREADDCKLCIQEDCSHFDQNSDLKAADFGILKYQEVCGKSAKGRKMAEENNGNNLCESSDSIMTILDQMADSVQLDYTGGHIVLWSLELLHKQSHYK